MKAGSPEQDMSARQGHRQFSYRRSPDQDVAKPTHHSVIIVGAGPVGLSLAIDLAQRGQKVVVLDDNDRIGDGSRAICFAKRTLEIFDRLGVGDRMVEKGVVWRAGKVFQGSDLVYEFDLLPEGGHKRPAFINLQQYYAESYLADRAAELPLIDLRWKNRVANAQSFADHAQIAIATPEGPYPLTCDWLIACDGARSPLRDMMGLPFRGETFEDQFLIADVSMAADFPPERRFWFDPPFHPGRSALLHKQPDESWRIDLQLGVDADAETERKPERVEQRIARMLGHDRFKIEWLSIYRFQCRRIDHFIMDRVIFAGDSAHQVSPFGARGANSGVQDADNLGWKLDLVLRSEARETLVDSYEIERGQAADENIAHSTRSTDFIAPHSKAELRLRDAALALSRGADFAKSFVNSGRLSTATHYRSSPLSTPDADEWREGVPPGAPLVDAPLIDASGEGAWLSDLVRPRFTLATLAEGVSAPMVESVDHLAIGVSDRATGLHDVEDLFAQRYDLRPGDGVLFRPDGHVAARFRDATPEKVRRALAKAGGLAT